VENGDKVEKVKVKKGKLFFKVHVVHIEDAL
jgi:hypothetical protein